MIRQNIHTHTVFCDGKNTVEEMIQSAIGLGLDSLGFTGHACFPFESCWAMKDGVPPLYYAEVQRQRERYGDQIDIFLGIEQDVFSDPPGEEYEYTIGSVHYVKKNGVYYSMDHSSDIFVQGAKEGYDGDYMAMAEDYFALVASVPERTNCQIVGHLDIICKFNEGDRLFDTAHPRYVTAAMTAIEELAKKDVILEINTGAMSRGYRTAPYPAVPLLRAMREKNIPICITSDTHSVSTILHAFPLASELAESCGYRECMYLTKSGFISGPLPCKF